MEISHFLPIKQSPFTSQGDHTVLPKTSLSKLNVISFHFCLVITMLPFRAPNFLLAS